MSEHNEVDPNNPEKNSGSADLKSIEIQANRPIALKRGNELAHFHVSTRAAQKDFYALPSPAGELMLFTDIPTNEPAVVRRISREQLAEPEGQTVKIGKPGDIMTQVTFRDREDGAVAANFGSMEATTIVRGERLQGEEASIAEGIRQDIIGQCLAGGTLLEWNYDPRLTEGMTEEQVENVSRTHHEKLQGFVHGSQEKHSPDKLRFSTQNAMLYAQTNGGIPRERSETGRIYINSTLEGAADNFTWLTEELVARGIAADIKVACFSDQKEADKISHLATRDEYEAKNQSLSRRKDKIVLYIDPAQQEQVRVLLDDFQQQAEGLVDSTPFMTEPIKDNDGKPLRGISFGQEPKRGSGMDKESFSTSRSAIFFKVIEQAEAQGKKWFDPSFDFSSALSDGLKAEGYDPKRPAYNPGGELVFWAFS